jgi:hypothetical protein
MKSEVFGLGLDSLKMETKATASSKAFARIYQTTRYYVPENLVL